MSLIILPSPGTQCQGQVCTVPGHSWWGPAVPIRPCQSALAQPAGDRDSWCHGSPWTNRIWSGGSTICKSNAGFERQRTLTFIKMAWGAMCLVRWWVPPLVLRAKRSGCCWLCCVNGFNKLSLISYFECLMICSNFITPNRVTPHPVTLPVWLTVLPSPLPMHLASDYL